MPPLWRTHSCVLRRHSCRRPACSPAQYCTILHNPAQSPRLYRRAHFCYPSPIMLNKGLYLISLSVCACGSLLGQGTTSRVLGTVQDASGAVVPAATVKLVNERTRITFTSTTSSAGSYVFEAVQPGSYELD